MSYFCTFLHIVVLKLKTQPLELSTLYLKLYSAMSS